MALLICTVGLLALAGAVADDIQTELSKLEGTWTVVSMEIGGRKVSDDQLKQWNTTLTLKGDKYTTRVAAQVDQGTIKVDLAKKPKEMDVLGGEGPNRGRTFRIIYELEGDNFKACYGEPDKDRPKEFKTAAGTQQVLITYKREKRAAGAATDDAGKKEMEKFQGTWKIVSLELNGMKLPEENYKNARLTVTGDKFAFKDVSAGYAGTMKWDLTKKPKTIDLVFTEGPEKGNTAFGIYEIEGDTYKVCLGLTGKSRPTEFVSKPGSGHALEVFKREKP